MSRWGTFCNGLYGEASLKRSRFFRDQANEKVGISLIAVDEGVRKSVMQISKLGVWKGYHFNRKYTKGLSFLSNMLYI